MGEIAADTRYGPGELPADAMLVIRWEEGTPSRWVTVGIATGYETLEAAREDAYHQVPGLADQWVLVTKITAQARKEGYVRVRSRETVTVDETPPA